MAHGQTYKFTLGDRLRAARTAAGYDDQRSFAKLTGLSRNSISNYERGVTVPRQYVIQEWARVTGFDPAWLTTGELSDDEDCPHLVKASA